MTRLHTYLTFNGNCREAMEFYQQCLGGDLNLQELGSSPHGRDMPTAMKERILHATLVNDQLIIMGSDLVGEEHLRRGNAVSLLLHCGNESEIRVYYERLSDGGKATHPLRDTHWGALFGDLIDRYGNQWLFHCDTRPEKS